MDANDRRERIAEEAAEWWVTLQGEVTRVEREQFIDWLRESGLHVAEMLRIAQVHGALKQFERWSKISTDGSGGDEDVVVPLPNSETPPKPTPDIPKRTPRLLTLALAAALVLVAVGLSVNYWLSLRGTVIETARGERRDVSLADGSTVQVDPQSRLRVKYEPERRLVVLDRGRALFHVAKNKERPFLVTADGTTVRAVGTAFGVEKRDRGVVVTVSEGRVAVGPTPSVSVPAVATSPEASAVRKEGSADVPAVTARRAAGSSKRSPEVLLDAGEQVTVAEGGGVEPVRAVDSGRALAWADGRLVFENDSVEHVVEEFNRYNRIQLEVRDAELVKRPISGTFSAADPESFVAFLQTVVAVNVRQDDAGNTVIEPAR